MVRTHVAFEGGQDGCSFVLRQHPSKGTVLTQIAGLRCTRDQCLSELFDRTVEQSGPPLKGTRGLSASINFAQRVDVGTGDAKNSLRIEHQLACYRVTEPQAPPLIACHPTGAASEVLDVAPAYASVCPDDDIGQVASNTEVNYMLSRRTEDLGGLPRRY
jgi:hypothetical protein